MALESQQPRDSGCAGAMGWASKIRAHGASKQPKQRRPPPVVHTTWLQTRYPNEETGDPGSVVAVHYTVEDNVVTLTSPKGAPIGKQATYVLQPDDAAVHVARRLAMVGPTWQREVTGPIEVAWIV